jgi:PAS domain S-box-containing protein
MLRAAAAPRPYWTLAALCVAAAAWCGQALVGHAAGPALCAGLCLVGFAALAAAAFSVWRTWSLQQRSLAAVFQDADRNGAIIEHAGEAIVVIDESATIVTFNRAAERMFGYSADQMIGRSLELLMTDGARENHRAYLARHGVTAMVEAARATSVHKGVRKRGEVFPFELTMTEWRDGGRRMFTGVMRDVTDHQRTAQALVETKARFDGVYENFATPMFTYGVAGDGGFVLESMNRVAEDFTGLTRFATIGRSPDEMAPGEGGRALRRAMLEAMTSGEVVTAEVGLLTPEGPRVMPLAISPMHEGARSIRRVLVNVRERAQAAVAA